MAHFVGLDVSVKETSVCVVDDAGKVILEQKVLTEPDTIIALLTLARRHLRPDRDRGRAAVAVAGQCVDGGRAAVDLRRDAPHESFTECTATQHFRPHGCAPERGAE